MYVCIYVNKIKSTRAYRRCSLAGAGGGGGSATYVKLKKTKKLVKTKENEYQNREIRAEGDLPYKRVSVLLERGESKPHFYDRLSSKQRNCLRQRLLMHFLVSRSRAGACILSCARI